MSGIKRKPNTKCLICHKPLYRRPSELKSTLNRSFCSKECFGVSCRRESPCLICKSPILAGLNKKTCSRQCANIHRTGIKYKLNQPKDKVKSQRALKMRLISKRGKFCERCGYSKIEILEVHHKDRDRKNNELDNLELICPNCHSEEHFLKNRKKYGGVA